mmetsp:Transcript_1962/g.3432  ORF Transcript_1962/g.3432 Transcript_1962/m.3432 type:complete len:140 (+) Transcript_1962:1769-2188(+)
MSLSLVNTCSIVNFVNDLFQGEIVEIFEVRFLVFSGLIQSPKNSERFRQQLQGRVHKIQSLFEIQDKLSLAPSQGGKPPNLANECVIQTLNRFFHLVNNIDQLRAMLLDEFEHVVTHDLKIGEEAKQGGAGDSSDSAQE